MALKTYTAGKVAIETTELGYLIDGTLTVDVGSGDISKIGTAWNAVTELGKGWTLAVSCNYDPADTAQAALITGYTSGEASFSAVSLYDDASVMHSGSALLTNAVVTKAVGQVDKFSATFTGNGALTHA